VGATAGAQSVTVTNPDGQSKTGTGILTISGGGGGGPTVTSVVPNSLGQGGSRSFTVNGTNFDNTAATSVSGTGVTVVSTTFVSSTKLTVKLKAAASAATGARDVTVTTSGGSGTCTGCRTIDVAPAPTSTSPNSGAHGSTLNVDVLGSNFVSGAKATFGTGITVNSVTFVNSGKLTESITISSTATLGARTVKVVNPDKGVGSCAGCFTVT
jgi:hypothetical protein